MKLSLLATGIQTLFYITKLSSEEKERERERSALVVIELCVLVAYLNTSCGSISSIVSGSIYNNNNNNALNFSSYLVQVII